MSIKLYYDLLSQPSRAIYILLKMANCEFQQKLVNLRIGEHFNEEYSAISRFQKVPVIDYKGFILSESVAIMRLLSRENIVPSSLYPVSSREQAIVDEYLEWQHIGLRLHCAMFFRIKTMMPRITGVKADPDLVKRCEGRMINALEEFDKLWLGRNEFVTGDTISVADLFAAVELEQPKVEGFDPAERFPNIAAWWPKVRKHFNPHYDEAHIYLDKLTDECANITHS